MIEFAEDEGTRGKVNFVVSVPIMMLWMGIFVVVFVVIEVGGKLLKVMR